MTCDICGPGDKERDKAVKEHRSEVAGSDLMSLAPHDNDRQRARRAGVMPQVPAPRECDCADYLPPKP